jgi:hypothetical protein
MPAAVVTASLGALVLMTQVFVPPRAANEPVSFPGATLMVPDDNGYQERKVSLALDARGLVVEDAGMAVAFETVPYEQVSAISYERSGDGAPPNALYSIPWRRSDDEHRITVEHHDESGPRTIYLKLDPKNAAQAVMALEARAGVPVERVAPGNDNLLIRNWAHPELGWEIDIPHAVPHLELSVFVVEFPN